MWRGTQPRTSSFDIPCSAFDIPRGLAQDFTRVPAIAPQRTPALSPETPKVSLAVAMVAWRSRATLPMSLGALRSLRREFDLDLAIVDNASGDGTADEARRLAPWATVVENPENVGFARASNQAASLTRAPLLLFLNPDAGIGVADVRRLTEALNRRPRAAAAAPVLFDRHGRLWPSGAADPGPWRYWLHYSLIGPACRRLRSFAGTALRGLGFGLETRPVDWLMGACLLVRRSAFEEAGGFPDSYFLYSEDAELGFRFRQRGYENLYVGAARALHDQGASAEQSKAETRVAFFRSLRLYGQRCRDSAWLRGMRRSIVCDMRLRLAWVAAVRPFHRRRDALAARRAAYEKILDLWMRPH